MQEGHDELEQAGTSEANVEREISTTEQLNVTQTVEGEQRGTPTTTAPFAQRLLSARSHLPPFSFPQVRLFVKTELCLKTILYYLIGMHLQYRAQLFKGRILD